jgi:hypothetical protein
MNHNAKNIIDFLDGEELDFQLFMLLTLEEQSVLNDKTLYKKLNKKELKDWYTIVGCYRLSQMLESRKLSY